MSEEETKIYPWRKVVKTLPPSLKIPLMNLIKTGHIPELSSFREKVREGLGMQGSPPTAYQNENALVEVQDLVKQTCLDRKVAWNWRKKKSEY